MSGVSIVNQIIFVFNLCIFGASSGAGIFTAQFHGSGDVDEGIRHTFRFKLFICTLISLAAGLIFFLGQDGLIGLYLTGEGTAEDAAQVLAYGKDYLAVMLWGLLPFGLANAYAGTLKVVRGDLRPHGRRCRRRVCEPGTQLRAHLRPFRRSCRQWGSGGRLSPR